jgi:ubiquinone/menaquinone biosynthesis C-methylase UbiE
MESYARAFSKTVSKVFYVNSNSQGQLEYQLYTLLMRVLTREISLEQTIPIMRDLTNSLTRKPMAVDNRTGERISTITSMNAKRNLIPRTVLDIGAGNGDITMAVKQWYNVPSSAIFAIDRKLPNIPELTALQYQITSDNPTTIPLPDNSIDLVIIFAVLHHIAPSDRVLLMKEVARVLSPSGAIVIREHDDNRDPNFQVFLAVLHIFWYIVSNETIDPLYLMDRAELHNLFARFDLHSVDYMAYPMDNNPQRLYHEMFVKTVLPLKLSDEVKQRIQQYIDMIRNSPRTEETYRRLPYQIQLKFSQDPFNRWPEMIKEYSISLIRGAKLYSPRSDAYYLTVDAVDQAARDMAEGKI